MTSKRRRVGIAVVAAGLATSALTCAAPAAAAEPTFRLVPNEVSNDTKTPSSTRAVKARHASPAPSDGKSPGRPAPGRSSG